MPEARTGTEIAIIGLAGRFPGANNPDAFWQNLRAGVESISFFSDQELTTRGVDPALIQDPAFVKAAATLDDIELFDAGFFGINPKEAELMDPQHRILLECAWDALEGAGYNAQAYEGLIGVYVGAAVNTYLLFNLLSNPEIINSPDQTRINIGNAADFLATRISYKMGLRGPSMTVQTACSTSLVAVHLACQSLLDEECDMALAGGVSVNVSQRNGYRYVEDGIVSPDGHCRPFDAEAQGTVFGSGVGVVVLKRLADALADGDTIQAVIRGSALNNDGTAKVGFTAPSVDGQAEVITEAQAIAGVAPETISYVEAHGTGTALGDPIEVAALTKAFQLGRPQPATCALGSVKANIGHLDAAAGIASLLKVVLALRAREIPPTLHFHTPNPQIPFATTPFYIPTQLQPWASPAGPRRAGVSSFGIGGTNAHLVVEESPPALPAAPAPRPWHLLLLAAKSEAALHGASANLHAYLTATPDASLADVAYTLQVGRRPWRYRRTLVCADVPGALAALDPTPRTEAATLDDWAVAPDGQRAVVFLLPGQGTQAVDMGRDLYTHEPVFRAALDTCADLLRPLLGRDLRAVLYPAPDQRDAAAAQLQQTALAQPALFAVSYALAQLWQAWGVVPQALLGHSLGEVVAATLAGVFTLPDALRVVAVRGRLMQECAPGAMLAVALSEAAVSPLLGTTLSLAAVNGPASCVVSGTDAAIAALETQLATQGVQTRRLHSAHAFHSALLDPMLPAFRAVLAQVPRQPPQRPVISNVSGTWLTDTEATDPDYWVRQARQPVRFADGLATVLAAGRPVLLEVGPGTTLSTLARQHPAREGAAVVASLRHAQASEPAEGAAVVQAVGRLWQAGVVIDWNALNAGPPRRRLPLPTYPFQRQRFWIEPARVMLSTSVQDDSLADMSHKADSIDGAAVDHKEASEDLVAPTQVVVAGSVRREQILTTLTRVICEVSGLEQDRIDPQAHFFEIGVDSLLLLQVNQAIKDQFGVQIALRQFFEELSSLTALARHIDQQLPAEDPSLVAQLSAPVSAPPTLPQPEGVPSVAPVQSGSQPLAAPSAPALDATAVPTVVGAGIAEVMTEQLAMLERLMAQQLAVLRDVSQAAAQPTAGLNRSLVPQPSSQNTAPPSVPPTSPSAAPAHSSQTRPDAPSNETFVPYRPLNTVASTGLSERQQQHLNTLIGRYTRRTQESKRHTQAYRSVLANNRHVAGFRLPFKEMIYQINAERADGAYIWDVDGHRYLDVSMGFGVYLFGHNPPFIADAIAAEHKRGAPLGPFSAQAGRVAALVHELTGVERVTFLNSGTEAVMVALRLARAVTKRSKIVIFAGAYHGTFDGILARANTTSSTGQAVPLAPGVTEQMVGDVLVLEYDNPRALQIIAAQADQLAAVLVEPVQSRRPDCQPREFLQQLRQITAASGSALIFDEVITGFRIDPGGAQAWFGVTADLVTYGKVIGGGMPIGVVAGTAAFMDGIDGGMWRFGDESFPPHDEKRTFVAGTFWQHPLTMAAAEAALTYLKQQGPQLQQRLSERTAWMVETLNSFFKQAGAPIQMVNFGSLFRFVLRGDAELLYYHLLERGIYIWEGRNCFLSTAHTDADITYLIQAVKDSVAEMQAGGFLPEPPSGGERVTVRDLTAARPMPTHIPPAAVAANGGSDPARAATQKLHTSATSHAQMELAPTTALAQPSGTARAEFSLFYFGGYNAEFSDDKYELLLKGASFADQHGFKAVWIPERHFHTFGGFSPNPSVLAAALARETHHVQIRAGSVVLPLHHPVRVAEEWSVVDNLSNGRIGVSFASGWHANDFVFAPETYGQHRAVMFERIETIHRLWRGETVAMRDGSGADFDVRLFPMPRQRELPTWVTVVSNPETYRAAGQIGANILTNLMEQTIEDLARNIQLYREARAQHGHDPASGHVTVLVHTFIGDDVEVVREQARQPFYNYLRSFLGLAHKLVQSQGIQINLAQTPAADVELVLATAYERYVATNALIGTPESCRPIVERLLTIGVDEIACFIDFGIDLAATMKGLEALERLKAAYSEPNSALLEPPATDQRGQIIPLTEEQMQLWFLTQVDPAASIAYNEAILLQLRGPLRHAMIEQSIQRLVERHTALRTTISSHGDAQHVMPIVAVDVPLIDFSALDPAERAAQIQQWLATESRRPFDLAHGPLIRAAVLREEHDQHLVVFVVHHIIADDWSRGVLLSEVAQLYSGACRSVPVKLLPATAFETYVRWQAQQATRPELSASKRFWQQQFSTPLPVLELPSDRLRPPLKTYAGARERLTLDPALCTSLKQLGARHGCTLFITLLGGFKTLLYRLAQQEDIVVGIPTAGQPLMGSPTLVGQCITMLPVHTQAAGEMPFSTYLATVKRTLLDVYEHQSYPLSRLEADDDSPQALYPPLITVTFNMDRPVTIPSFFELQAELIPFPISSAKFDLSLNGIEIDGQLQLDIEYNTDLFEAQTIQRWMRNFETLLQSLVESPAAPLRDVALLTSAERQQRIAAHQRSAVATDSDCLHQLFERQAAQTPTAIAIRSGDQQHSYEQVNKQANQLARHLQTLSIRPGSVVGLHGAALPELLGGALATLKLGGIPVVLDADWPSQHTAALIQATGLHVVITSSEIAAPSDHPLTIVALAAHSAAIASESSDNLDSGVAATQPAWLWCDPADAPTPFVLSHAALVAHCRALQQRLGLDSKDHLLSIHALSSSALLNHILPALVSGACVITAPSLSLKSAELHRMIADSGATLLDLPLRVWQQLMTTAADQSSPPPHAQLRQVIVRSAQLWPIQVHQPSTQLQTERVLWAYEPTTLPLTIATCEIDGQGEQSDQRARAALGPLLPHTELYLLDAQLQMVPAGAVGDVYVGGSWLSLFERAQTPSSLASNPFDADGQSWLYKTGDQARYRADNTIEPLGMVSRRAHVRGYEIDLDLIESLLLMHPAVTGAAVITQSREQASEGQRLIAYVGLDNSAAPLTSALRRHLQARLPEYMLPTTFLRLETLPQHADGSINYAALPSPETAEQIDDSHEAQTPMQELLATIWAEVLGVEQVGIHDNFFALGGHSLLATQLITRLRTAYQIELSLRTLFEAPNIAELALVLEQGATDSAGADDAAIVLPIIQPDPAQWHEPFRLTDVQQAYWIGRTGAFGLGNVATHAYYEVESPDLDLARLNQAWQRLIDRHGMLRAIVRSDGEQQILTDLPPYQIQVLDLRDKDPQAVTDGIEAVRQRMSHQVLPSDRWPLFEIFACQLGERHFWLHVSVDALIVDAWSMQIIFSELAQLYHEPQSTLVPLTISFRDYLQAEALVHDSSLYQRSLAYWQRRLSSLPPAPELPLVSNPNELDQPHFVRWNGRLAPDLWRSLKTRATSAGLTPSIVLLAAYAEVLALWSKRAHFTINLTLFNRLPLHEQVNEIVGDFTSVTLLEVDNSVWDTFEARARRLQKQLWEDMDHRYVSGVQVLRELARSQGVTSGLLMPVVFTSSLIHDAEELDTSLMSWLGDVRYSVTQTPQVWLDHEVYEDAGALVFTWDVVEELFPAGMIQDMFDAFSHLLKLLASEQPIWQRSPATELLPVRHQEQIDALNSTDAPLAPQLLHTLFIEQVALRPEQLAVITPSYQLSYDELHRRADQLGRQLRAAGAQPNQLVAVVMEKGWEQIVAVLGVLYAGAAYLPIDAALPQERLDYLLAHSQSRLAVTQTHLRDRLVWPQQVQPLCVGVEDEAEVAVEPLIPAQTPDDLAYVIYTSGSTGLPKGVMIDHHSVVNTILDVNQRFDVGPDDRVLALSSLSFDLSVYDVFGLLAAGGTIVLPAADAVRDPAHWAELLQQQRITLWNSVPALMDLLTEYLNEHKDDLSGTLRLVMLSGDWIPLTLPERISALMPGTEVYSLGGATEASIWSIWYPIDAVDPGWKSIPYGTPMRNQRFYVLNDRLELCPTWAAGQLYIGGVGLARGYWYDEAKTSASFIIHPQTGERLYRTGDLGRYLPDGNIEFLGREDFQVKIQGYRVELGEIEAALLQHPQVRASVVVATGERHETKRLVAYVVPEPNAKLVADELRTFLRQKLQGYMVPSAFVLLAALPLTPNGKIDRQALPDPANTPATHAAEPRASDGRSNVTAQIAQIVAGVLRVEQVDPEIDLLSFGANSVDMVRIANILEREMAFRPRIDEFYRTPTVANLARAYEQLTREQGTAQGGAPQEERVILDLDEREAFKQRQPGIRQDAALVQRPSIQLDDSDVTAAERAAYVQRRSHRAFDQQRLPLQELSRLLNCLRQVTLDGKPKYLYPSAGGLYPIQTYLHIKPGRIDDLAGGIYYYHPIQHRLVALAENAEIDRQIHDPFVNRPIFDQAAFSIFLIAELDALRPMYGERSIEFATIESGYMSQLLMMVAPNYQIGLCPVGSLDFDPIRHLFELHESHLLVHSFMGGRIEQSSEQGWSPFQESYSDPSMIVVEREEIEL